LPPVLGSKIDFGANFIAQKFVFTTEKIKLKRAFFNFSKTYILFLEFKSDFCFAKSFQL